MCGLFGHTSWNINSVELSRKALHTLTHRGPDSWGEWHDDRVYIGHRRLSILDLTDSGHQPMVSEQSKVVLTVNGEIYNYKELRNSLKEKYEFKSESDSEVLLHGYIEWGIDTLLKKIDGMYAFVIYDIAANKIILARDRVGIKPLYIAHWKDTFIWASELKAIQTFIGTENLEFDQTALYDFLTYLYIPTPKTAYKDITKLKPGCYAEISLDTGQLSMHRYWSLAVEEIPITPHDAADELKHLLSQSTQEQMIADVPLGFFLSGGLDSSTVVAEAVKYSNDVNTYSIGFNIKNHDETTFAQEVADCFGTHHDKKILEVEESRKLFASMKGWYDEPFADTSALPTYLVSEFARKGSTVVLTGDGGDEVFGGYRWYDTFSHRANRRFPAPGWAKKSIRGLASCSKGRIKRTLNTMESFTLTDDVEFYAKIRSRTLKHEKKEYRKLFGIPDDYDDYWYYRKHYRPELPVKTRLQYLDFCTYLPDQILTKVDRTTMAVSLEARVPLLSKDLIEFSFRLPETVRYHGNDLKGLLKLAYKDILPDNILNRGKKGFSIPLNQWQSELMEDGLNREETILKRWLGVSK